jgi:hypothetical protein
MGVFKKIINPIYNWLARRYPGFVFLREYSSKNLERREMIRKIFSYASACKVPGDYLEFGVFKGGTFVEAVKAVELKKNLGEMKFYAFDSFRGLPEPKGVDAHSDQFRGGTIVFGLDDFKKELSRQEIDLNKVRIVPGWFKDTLNAETKKKLDVKSAAVIWVDCDLYESTVPVLEFVKDYIVDGTVLVFDDWFFYKGHPERGERKAFAEWLNKNPQFSVTEFHKYSWHGNSFIIHKRQ